MQSHMKFCQMTFVLVKIWIVLSGIGEQTWYICARLSKQAAFSTNNMRSSGNDSPVTL